MLSNSLVETYIIDLYTGRSGSKGVLSLKERKFENAEGGKQYCNNIVKSMHLSVGIKNMKIYFKIKFKIYTRVIKFLQFLIRKEGDTVSILILR